MSAETWLRRGCECPYDEFTGSKEVNPDATEPQAYAGSDPALRAVYGVLKNLGDRRGIKWELEAVDQGVRRELVATLTEIVRAAFAPNGAARAAGGEGDPCGCIAAMDAALTGKGLNTKVERILLLGKSIVQSGALVRSVKVDDKKRGKPTLVVASCCPFCGIRYPKGDA